MATFDEVVVQLEALNPLFKPFWPDEMRDDKGQKTFVGWQTPNRFRGGVYARLNESVPAKMKALFGNMDDLKSCSDTLGKMGVEARISELPCFFILEFSSDEFHVPSMIGKP